MWCRGEMMGCGWAEMKYELRVEKLAERKATVFAEVLEEGVVATRSTSVAETQEERQEMRT